MKTIIKEYQGKLGKITVEKYEECGAVEYHVKHSNPIITPYWCKNKVDAIKHAQFLAGKY